MKEIWLIEKRDGIPCDILFRWCDAERNGINYIGRNALNITNGSTFRLPRHSLL